MPNSEGMMMLMYHIMWWLTSQGMVIHIEAALRISVSLSLNVRTVSLTTLCYIEIPSTIFSISWNSFIIVTYIVIVYRFYSKAARTFFPLNIIVVS
jgi:hypothetical protein